MPMRVINARGLVKPVKSDSSKKGRDANEFGASQRRRMVKSRETFREYGGRTRIALHKARRQAGCLQVVRPTS